MKLKHILRQIYADKVQIRHFANLLMASISKTYQMRDQGMSIPSEPPDDPVGPGVVEIRKLLQNEGLQSGVPARAAAQTG